MRISGLRSRSLLVADEGFHVLAQVELEGRLAVPEQVVGHAHARRDVVPVDTLASTATG